MIKHEKKLYPLPVRIPETKNRLLDWFDVSRRDLPWRKSKDPYRIWVSEIMLQQTQVQTVIPYFERFIQRYPTLSDLAAADETCVLKLWEGLGYYSRARNLLAAARWVVQNHQGTLPPDEKILRELPGIGTYTANAILSIAFNQKVPAIDGNVMRVFSRLTGSPWQAARESDRKAASQIISQYMPEDRPGDFNEAIMDLGATICVKQKPFCEKCPVASCCIALAENRVDTLPLSKNHPSVPVEHKMVLVICSQGLWHINRRPGKGLLAGLYTFDWARYPMDLSRASDVSGQTLQIAEKPIMRLHPSVQITRLPDKQHRFSHRIWSLSGFRIDLSEPDLQKLSDFLQKPDEETKSESSWVTSSTLRKLPFPVALELYREAVLS